MDACTEELSTDYPIEDLRVASGRELLYPRGDTHWNGVGAFHAYQRWASLVAEEVPLRVFDRAEARLFVNDKATADLGSKCLPPRPHELHDLVPSPPRAVLIEDNMMQRRPPSTLAQ